jgi:Holliday junction resolvase RusA-like endonuclease
MTYEFEVPSKIIGKGRPRLNSYTGIVYTPTRTKDYETLIEQYFLMKYPQYKTIEGRAKVKIQAYFEIPKSTTKKQKEGMLVNSISPTKKPDIDNIVKVVLDAMNKFAFKDDTQIVKLEVEKLYSASEEKIVIQIEEF